MGNRAVDGETLTQNAENGTLLTALVHAVNTLFNGCIPEELQSSLLISLYKKNDPTDMDNRRMTRQTWITEERPDRHG